MFLQYSTLTSLGNMELSKCILKQPAFADIISDESLQSNTVKEFSSTSERVKARVKSKLKQGVDENQIIGPNLQTYCNEKKEKQTRPGFHGRDLKTKTSVRHQTLGSLDNVNQWEGQTLMVNFSMECH